MNDVINETFLYNSHNYKVIITFKYGMRNVNYRYDIDKDTFIISAPKRTSKRFIYKNLEECAPSLLKKAAKYNKNKAIDEGHVYVFGKIMPIVLANRNQIFFDHLEVKDKMGLMKLLKLLLTDYINEQLPYYSKLMNVKAYKFSIRDMHTRHGSNRRSISSLSFALSLVHYSGPIIDSVIVHELAHDIEFNHSKAFYDIVYKYCPNYKKLHKALNSKEFSYGINN